MRRLALLAWAVGLFAFLVALGGCAGRRCNEANQPAPGGESPLRYLPGRIARPDSAGAVSPTPPAHTPPSHRQAPAPLPDGPFQCDPNDPDSPCYVPTGSVAPKPAPMTSGPEPRETTARVVCEPTVAEQFQSWICSWVLPGAIFGAFLLVAAWWVGYAAGKRARGAS